MSRGFQQSSLSSAGLFVAHSGTMQAVNFVNENQLYFECYYNFCFFVATAPNLCTNVSFSNHGSMGSHDVHRAQCSLCLWLASF